MAKHSTEELDTYLRQRVVKLSEDQRVLEEEIGRCEQRVGNADELKRHAQYQGHVTQAHRDTEEALTDKARAEQELARVVDEIECLADLRELALPGTSQPVATSVVPD